MTPRADGGCLRGCALSQFFQRAREAMFITSREGLIVDCNDALLALLGYGRGELVGGPVARILDPATDRGRYQALVEAEGVVQAYPVTMRRRDGAPVPCAVDAIAWREDGRVLGYNGIVRTRSSLLRTLAPHLGDELIERLDAAGADPLASGRLRITALFFDIRGSTAIAERASPEDFAAFLGEILTDVMDLVCGCRGTVNKLLGDGLLAVFGAPVGAPDDAANAVEAALRIRDYLATFNDVRPEFLAEPVQAGIGIATGEAFAGLIGSVRRQEYTVLGDPVNLASRLEALTKGRDDCILLDEATVEAAGSAWSFRPVLAGRVRGRAGTVRVYGVDG